MISRRLQLAAAAMSIAATLLLSSTSYGGESTCTGKPDGFRYCSECYHDTGGPTNHRAAVDGFECQDGIPNYYDTFYTSYSTHPDLWDESCVISNDNCVSWTSD